MGRAGRKLALEQFYWSIIIPRYVALWRELAERRRAGGATAKPAGGVRWPARLDPFAAFAGYPTTRLEAGTRFSLVDGTAADAMERWRRLRRLTMVRFAEAVLPTEAECEAVLAVAAGGPAAATDLVSAIPEERRAVVYRGLVWLAKLGILEARR